MTYRLRRQPFAFVAAGHILIAPASVDQIEAQPWKRRWVPQSNVQMAAMRSDGRRRLRWRRCCRTSARSFSGRTGSSRRQPRRLQDDLCPLVDGRHVHRHILWTYDFCNDHLKWLADYVDLARVIQLATGHHKAAPDDAAALILDAADRLAAGGEEVEIEELQPVIPPQVPLESILWNIDQAASCRAGTAQVSPQATQRHEPGSGRTGDRETGSSGDSEQRRGACGGAPAARQRDRNSGHPRQRLRGRQVQRITAMVLRQPGPCHPSFGLRPGPADAGLSTQDSALSPQSPVRVLPRPAIRRDPQGYFKAQVLQADEDVLPTAKRPEMNEQDYRDDRHRPGGGLPEDRADVGAAADRVAGRGAAQCAGASAVAGAGSTWARAGRRSACTATRRRGRRSRRRCGSGTRTRGVCRRRSRSR